ncbi:LysM peptidoglycan-binding domain-containing protein [Lysinibacillus sp. KU-BSD001]|uniref:LysM peptidoglycan-binding domain-containing protein n=1 Tax=Lysinibacillus sp. KU-BSD001 TaxID=3141328 RepID=UPI0036E6225E
MIIHVVRKGESLWALANRYNIHVDAIQQINQLPNPNHLLIGQSILIPVPGSMHTVKQGETLSMIAQRYGVSVDAITLTNELPNPDVLYPGMRLYIPPIIHVIQPGETLWQIAKLYGISTQMIIDANQIQNPNIIYAGVQLIIPRAKPTIEVNAYTYQSDEAGAKSINTLSPLFTYVSPFAYMVKEDGTLEPFDDDLMLAAAKDYSVVPMMSITNFTSTEAGSNLAHIVLASPDLREKLITNILQVMDEKGYKGINVDFENVLPEDREHYNAFLQLAVDRLHPKDYFVSTAVAPKTSSAQQGLLYEAHDYEGHGKIVDFVVLMTYEWGWRGGPPTAISPINQMRNVVEYALSVIPADKLFLGFQIYARDWKVPHTKGQEAETISAQEAIRRANQYSVTIQYDTTAQSPFFRYVDEQGQQHEVWFEDARSAQAKFDLVKEYNLQGISYWVLGYPFPQNWVLLDDHFLIRKLTY